MRQVYAKREAKKVPGEAARKRERIKALKEEHKRLMKAYLDARDAGNTAFKNAAWQYKSSVTPHIEDRPHNGDFFMEVTQRHAELQLFLDSLSPEEKALVIGYRKW